MTFKTPVKKWHEYSRLDIINIEKTKDAYISSYLKLCDKILDCNTKIGRPDIFPRTKIHKANLERFEKYKAEAQEHIDECEKHLKTYYDGANCRFY